MEAGAERWVRWDGIGFARRGGRGGEKRCDRALGSKVRADAVDVPRIDAQSSRFGA